MNVLICRGPDLEAEDVCQGATPDGGCPHAAAGQPVRCAGRQIVVKYGGQRPYVLSVEANATACPVAAFGLPWSVKQRSTADRSSQGEANDHDG